MRLALAQWAVRPCDGLEPWTARLDAAVAEAAARGAELAVLPEYAGVEMAASPSGPDLVHELATAAALSGAAVEAARGVAARHGVWLLPGTLPFRVGDHVVNRAPLLSPAGGVAFQDKHVLTRFEDEVWGVSPGGPPGVFATPWGPVGIAICFDVEFPTVVRAQVVAGAWLVLAPSCTETAHGSARVHTAAAARAMENQCYVAVSPTIGHAPGLAALDANRGHAAVYGPIDRGFPEDGVLARGARDEPGWVFCDLDPARLRTVRREGAVLNHARWPDGVPPCAVVPL